MSMQVLERLDGSSVLSVVGSVSGWQHILNGCGYQPRLGINGHIDQRTVTATKRFQKDLGLPDTGKVDLATWRAGINHPKIAGWEPIVPPLACPAPSGMSDADKYEYYRLIIKGNGGKFHEATNQRNLLGLRKETNVYANRGRGHYDDFLVMLWRNASGQTVVREYSRFCTEPIGRFEGKYGDDADEDGDLDLGRIPEGYYEYSTGSFSTLGKVLRPKLTMKSVRDINEDGRFSPHEPATSAGKSILFHAGNTSDTGSAGCQTLPPNDFKKFWADLTADGNPGIIGYTLVHRVA